MATVGQRLRQARNRRILTQADLAAAVGMPVVTISRIENDRIEAPRTTTIRKLAAALDVDPAWLLFGDEQESKMAA